MSSSNAGHGHGGGRRLRLRPHLAVPATVLLTLLLQLLPAAQRAEATCVYNSDTTHKWTVELYALTNCVRSSGGYLQYWGTNECRCFNIGSALNDRVNSFVFTSGNKRVDFYQDTNCGGTRLGYSQGNWIKNPTSANGRTMSSFYIC